MQLCYHISNCDIHLEIIKKYKGICLNCISNKGTLKHYNGISHRYFHIWITAQFVEMLNIPNELSFMLNNYRDAVSQ